VTNDPLSGWLRTHELEQYAQLFAEHDVDLRTLRILTDDDLKELGLPFGPRKRILKALAELDAVDVSAVAAGSREERRQLTVLFCDMVGFTELAGRVDPEVLHGIIRQYEDACATGITRYDGYVFQRLGDGIVAFFGFPLAHEGEAERAIRAGLEILDTLRGLEVPVAGRLRVRIGIATGMVVVSSAERGAVGETMNLAARLQSIATPGEILVSGRVQRLAGGAFEYEDLGEQTLKGIGVPVRAYRVLHESAAVSRFDAATGQGVGPLVGREEELADLLERWRMARTGTGQVVALSGEPGIGKSRLVRSLRERLEAHGAGTLRFQCSPYHLHSAFQPIISNLQRVLAYARDESASSRLDKLEALVVDRFARPAADLPLLAAILSLPSEERYGPPAMSPRRQKEQTIRALVDLVEAIAHAGPTLLLFEDLHWADPSTLEVLGQLIPRVRDIPLLAVLTHRPEFAARWTAEPHVSAVDLGRLSPPQSRALVVRLTGGKSLPPGLLEQIVEKTDGIPLFVEELTRSILESGDLAEAATHYAYTAGAGGMIIPATLRDSLTARLDRLGPAKALAQIGAAIGREFSYELLAALEPMTDAALTARLAPLVESGLAFQQGTVPHAVYTFKHALVQDAAYDSMLKSRRQQLHQAIAETLEARWPETADTAPELLAQHYTAAGQAEAAVPYWRRAGEVALKRFALAEAAAHLQAGLALVERLPAGAARERAELELRTLLTPALVAVRGWAAPEVGGLLEPALALARSLRHRESYLPLLHGLWVHHMSAGRHAEAMGFAQELLKAGADTGDDLLEICGHRAAMTSHFWMGRLAEAQEHGDRIRALYDLERHRPIAALTNNDPLTADGSYRAQYLWMLGYPDQALALSDAKDELARRRGHPFDLAFAMTVGALAWDYAGRPEELIQRAEEAAAVGREHGLPLMSEVMAEIVAGIAWLRAGRVEESVERLQRSLADLLRTGHRAWVPYVRAVLGEALARAGDPAAGLRCVEESLAQVERQDERVHLAEILRLQGWILSVQGRTDDAQRSLCAALEVARAQGTRSWELRAATTLARLLVARGERGKARALLTPVYGWFTEGFDTRDLTEARTLIEELANG
jgi:class 3 adenylate cyclase/tetratricopeptide (TPR) repeat protein